MSQIIFQDPIVSSGPTGTGTGNGTCTVDRLTHFTIAQTYTLTCIAKSPDTVFNVVGSLDGSVGVAIVGTQFFDEELKVFLTLAQGSTVFEVGDQFVFTTVNGTDLNQANIDSYDELAQKNFGVGVFGTAAGDHNIRYSNTSLAAFLYLQDLKFTAVTAGSGGNSITMQFLQYTAAVAASRVIQDLTYTAVTAGTGGNSISVTYVGDGVAGSETVGVVGSAITVHMESTVSTATQIRTAVLASGAAAALVSVAVSGTGSNTQTSVGATSLTGGAAAIGLAGSEFVSVSTNTITVRLESGVSTSTQVKTALDASVAAAALISTSISGVSSAPQFPTTGALNLAGGKNKNYALNHNESTDSGSFLEGNANVRAQEVTARGGMTAAGRVQLTGTLGLADTEVVNVSGPAISNVQAAINALIQNRQIEINTSDNSFVTWSSNQISFTAAILINFRTGSIVNTIALSSSPVSLADGESLYVILNPFLSSTVTGVVASTVATGLNAFRLATRVGTALIWYNGNSFAASESGRIGDTGSSTTALASSIMRRDSSANAAANKMTVAAGSGNGIDVASAGNFEIGASVGANTVKIGGSTSTVEIEGDLTVQGTTTTLNTATLDVEDKNIKVNLGGNDATSEGAGITVDRTSTKGSIIYAAAAASKFKIGDLSAEVEVADISTSQTLTNKKLSDSTTEIVDVSDPTKKIKFDAAGTTGTKTTLLGSQTSDQVLTLPDATDTLVGKATSDVLTNKTLTGNTAANLISGSGTLVLNTTGTATVPNATDTLVGKATTDSLTNKSLVDSSTNIVDAGDPTKKIAFDAGGTTGTKTTITGGQTADRVLTLPDATDTLVGKATTDTLTNKTLTGNTAVNLVSGSGTLVLNTTGTATVPNATDTLVGKATTDTLTNKTLAVGSNHITGTVAKIAQFNASTGDLEAGSVAPTALFSTASYRAGNTSLTTGDLSKAVSFSSTLGTTSYRLVVQLLNITDASVQYMPITITAKAATGFTASWNGGVDSNNYVLEYQAILDN